MLAFRSAGDPADPIGPLWLERAIEDITRLGGYRSKAAVAMMYYLIAFDSQRDRILPVPN